MGSWRRDWGGGEAVQGQKQRHRRGNDSVGICRSTPPGTLKLPAMAQLWSSFGAGLAGMASHRLLPKHPLAVVLLVALVAGLPASRALDRTPAQDELPRKPRRRHLLEGGEQESQPGSTVPPAMPESELMINNPLKLCGDCPPVYGFNNNKKPGPAAVSIQADLSPDEALETPSWVVVMNKLAGCDPRLVCREAETVGKGRFDGRCTDKYFKAIRGFAVEMDYPNMAAFANATKECVSEVWRDATVSVQVSQRDPPWGLDRIDQLSLPLSDSYSYTADGTGVHAYIIDTGIRASHNQFQHQDGTPGSRVHNTYSGFDDNDSNDCHGHGTHVAATVAGLTFGVAKNVNLHAVRVLDCQGNAQYSRVIKALDYLASNHELPAVAVLSLGGEPYNALDLAVQAMVDSGITVAVAAGNDNREACLQSPARVPSVLTVAGSSAQDDMYWNSNYGKCVDIFAPGVKILSAVHTSDTATGLMTGTSMSAPFVAGAAALFLQRNPEALPYIVAHALITSGSSGQITKPKDSPNILLNTNVFSPVMFSPPEFRITEETADQAFWVSLTLAKKPSSRVLIETDPVSESRGTMTISRIEFEPTAWNQPQYFVFEPSAESPRGVSYNLVFVLESDDKEFDGLETYFQVTDSREKLGEDVEHPLEIDSLPFLDNRDTSKYSHVYNFDCSEWGDRGTGNDVVYVYRPPADQVVDISLCESDYDTKVYIFKNTADNVFGCNDDRCGYQSRLRIKLTAGDTFYIVVDGYDGESGRYILSIKEVRGLDLSAIPPGEVDEDLNPLPASPDGEGEGEADAELLSLALTNCDLSPAFEPNTTSYSCTMPPGSPEITVSYSTTNPDASVEVELLEGEESRRRQLRQEEGSLAAAASGYTQLQLQEGPNVVMVTVTSPGGGRESTYRVEVRLVSHVRETRLKSLTLLEGGPAGAPLSLSPPFSFSQQSYTAKVDRRISLLSVTAETLSSNPGIEVTASGMTLEDGSQPGFLVGTISLSEGQSKVVIGVTAADRETAANYMLELVRWGPWQACSRDCGGGVALRERTVLVEPAGGGAACPPLVDEQACATEPCDLHCSVSPWGQWGQCSARCGSGFPDPYRYVLDVPSGGGTCPELIQQRRCFVPTEQCYQDSDCQLGQWGGWSECSKPCGGGTQTRTREVVVPQLGSGRPCSVTEEVRPCNIQQCSEECMVSEFGRWGRCDSACGPGQQQRRRTIISVPSTGATAQCPPLEETRPCTSSPCALGQNPYPDEGRAEVRLPAAVVPEPDRKPFSLDSLDNLDSLPDSTPASRHRWVIYEYGECSSACGGGVQTRTVQCARIESNGWEISEDSVCLQEGAGGKPSTSRACNVQSCEGSAPLVSPWGTCSLTCGGGVRERTAACKGVLGLLLPRSSCLQTAVSTLERCETQPCQTSDNPSQPFWRLDAWEPCPVKCGGGLARRQAECVNGAGNVYSASACPSADLVLQRPCNSHPCKIGVWRVGPWGECSAGCQGTRSREVRCVELDDGDDLDDDYCLDAAPRPASLEPCGRRSCSSDCGPGASCSGSGLCAVEAAGSGASCSCEADYSGAYCEVPPTCASGVVDADGQCCPGPVDTATGVCCEPGSGIDASGTCCKSGVLDACGQCDGPALAVDVTGGCCATALDAAGLCCNSGALDECGVCDGDGTTCTTVLDLTFAVPSALATDLPAALSSSDTRDPLERDVKSFLADALLAPLAQSVGPELTRITTVAVLQMQPYSSQFRGVSANSDPGPLTSAIRAGDGRSDIVLLGDSFGNTRKPPEWSGDLTAGKPRKPRRHLQQQEDNSSPTLEQQVGMVPVSQAWLKEESQLLSVRVRIAGALDGEGTGISAALTMATLEAEVAAGPMSTEDEDDSGSRGPLHLAGITYAERRGICGNGFCEVGERLVAAGQATASESHLLAIAASYEWSLDGCHLDCPLQLLPCPVPPQPADEAKEDSGGGPGLMCGGAGRCFHASGMCECFVGYAGDDCGQCSPGYNRAKGGFCTPSAALLADARPRLNVSTSAGISPTTLFFVAMAVVVIGICTVVIGGAFIYLHHKRKSAAEAAGEANLSADSPTGHHQLRTKSSQSGVFNTTRPAPSSHGHGGSSNSLEKAAAGGPPPPSLPVNAGSGSHGGLTAFSLGTLESPSSGPSPYPSPHIVTSTTLSHPITSPWPTHRSGASTPPPSGYRSAMRRTSEAEAVPRNLSAHPDFEAGGGAPASSLSSGPGRQGGDPELFTNMYWFPSNLSRASAASTSSEDQGGSDVSGHPLGDSGQSVSSLGGGSSCIPGGSGRPATGGSGCGEEPLHGAEHLPPSPSEGPSPPQLEEE
eukprot:CAMPEP_0117696850 /NCGR_PEP_ID=MMETSP0804-20121206/28894_1 /TAXON_ID=1074897 /ORGANISM="Tetraselmis astigmatica, Strain CCMP880" /LENGTH=2321 /DNA_ID=CAMNT_0005511019 /DNA_START=558 /DNA_END=7525 /DNA_ORIENTATION=-